jgi:hypothetical protein
MKRGIWLIFVVMLVVSACANNSSQSPRLLTPTPPPDAAVRGSLAVAAANQQPPTLPPTITPSDTPPPPPPTGSPTPPPTPGPYEHVIQPGEDCIGIAYQYGHLDLAVIGLIQSMNNIQCSSLHVGATILVPRPTPTVTPVGADLTQTAVATAAPPNATLVSGPSFSLQTYVVQEGDTLSSIAIKADSSLRQICELNPLPDGIDCGGCSWDTANCCCPNPPVLSEGQQINVPAPPPTPTYTPTFTGSETPTFTPTHNAPQPVFPTAGSTVKGPVRLTWLSVGVLVDREYYLVMLRDDTTGTTFSASTRQLSLDIPTDYLPSDGQSHTFAWQVVVVRLGDDGLYYPQGTTLPEQRFVWEGWQ